MGDIPEGGRLHSSGSLLPVEFLAGGDQAVPSANEAFSRNLELVVVETRIVRSPTLNRMLSGEPVTYRAITIPSGFEALIQWQTDTRNGKGGRAEPPSGEGPRFTIQWELKPLGNPLDPFYWFEVRANERRAGGDRKDPSDRRPDVEKQPPACNSPIECDVLGIEGACDCESQCKDLTLNINRFAADAGGAVLPWSGQAWVDAIDLAFKGRDSATNLRIMRRHLTRVKNENSIFGPEWAFSPRRKKR